MPLFFGFSDTSRNKNSNIVPNIKSGHISTAKESPLL